MTFRSSRFHSGNNLRGAARMEPVRLRLELPFPDARFGPNARHDRRALAGAIKKAKNDSAFLVLEALGRSHPWRLAAPSCRIRIDFRFIPKALYAYDEDNLVARMKPYLDGVAEGLRCNDRLFKVGAVVIAPPDKLRRIGGPPVPPRPRVELDLVEVAA